MFAVVVGLAGCSSSRPEEVVRTDEAAASSEAGYCRTTTCAPPPEYPAGGLCEPAGWPQQCAAQRFRDVPLWWRSQCVGYSLQKSAGTRVSYEDASRAVHSAFAAWTNATCPTNGIGPSQVSIDSRDLGAVVCDENGYNRAAPNQNVISFRDQSWPHRKAEEDAGVLAPDGKSPTIALTTVTFDPATGEIYDVDMEINSADHAIVIKRDGDPVDGDTFDLQAVLTHEVGHFLGLAHTPNKAAVLYKSDEGNDVRKRALAQADIAGICAVYPPGDTRRVSTMVDPSGTVPATACDPTPRHGFSGECRHDTAASGCNASPFGPGSSSGRAALSLLALAALIWRRSSREAAADRGPQRRVSGRP